MADTLSMREEHADLLPYVEQLRFAADAVGETTDEEVSDRLEEALDFLVGHLVPHSHAEEKSVYALVEEITGVTEATATMRRDHEEIGRMVSELQVWGERVDGEPLDAAARQRLRALLYGLYAVVRLHFHKEEEIFLPLLEARVPHDRLHEVFAEMHEDAVRESGSVAAAQ